MPRTSLHGEGGLTLAMVEQSFGPFARRPEDPRCNRRDPGDGAHRCNRLPHRADGPSCVHAELRLSPDGSAWVLEAWTEHRSGRSAPPPGRGGVAP